MCTLYNEEFTSHEEECTAYNDKTTPCKEVITPCKAIWTPYSRNGPRREKTCLWRFANNTGADQPAHPRNLISAYVIRYLESIISRLSTGEISIF